MEKISSRNLDSPIGILGLTAQEGYIVKLTFGGTAETDAQEPVLDAAESQLREYFAGARRSFDVPIRLDGTLFQQKVWLSLLEIPYGETRAYSEIAAAVGSPRAARAVGMANHVNPIPVIIPCHRAIGKSGGLIGYAGGLEMKLYLLELERKYSLQ